MNVTGSNWNCKKNRTWILLNEALQNSLTMSDNILRSVEIKHQTKLQTNKKLRMKTFFKFYHKTEQDLSWDQLKPLS